MFTNSKQNYVAGFHASEVMAKYVGECGGQMYETGIYVKSDTVTLKKQKQCFQNVTKFNVFLIYQTM